MYSCRWAYCAAICDSLVQLDEHVADHIAHTVPIKLLGVKRRKIAPETWVRVETSQDQVLPSFQRLSDHLPVHNSQAGDTTITTDTTCPIPSFPSLPPPPSFPSPPPFSAYDHLDPPHDPFSEVDGFQSGLSGRVMEDDLEMSDEMLQEFLRSPSPDLVPPPLASTSAIEEPDQSSQPPVRPSARAVSPFVPPTQAILPSQLDKPVTQSATEPSSGKPAKSITVGTGSDSQIGQQNAALSPPLNTPARPHPGPAMQPDPSPESVEIGRSANTLHETTTSQTMYHNIAPIPQTPVNAKIAPLLTSARFSLSRQDAAPALPITFGSAITQDSPAPESSQTREKFGHKGRLSLGGFGTPVNKGPAGPRSSVGFTFGSRLASPSGKR